MRIMTGVVQYEDFRRVSQAKVELCDQEGSLLDTHVTSEGGVFIFRAPDRGIYSIRAVQSSLSSESMIVKITTEPLTEVILTLAPRQELTLEVVASLPPIQHHVSSETYSVSRKDIEELSRGNNIELKDVLLTLPSAVDGGLGQVHIRQEHAGLQFRIDGVPIPDTVSSVFSDVLSPRTWERANVILGGSHFLQLIDIKNINQPFRNFTKTYSPLFKSSKRLIGKAVWVVLIKYSQIRGLWERNTLIIPWE